jgi:hypothetical protein
VLPTATSQVGHVTVRGRMASRVTVHHKLVNNAKLKF